ncbi:MAG: site-2 protease family protein [Pyramidobacter sp.]|nr:site-2 protease family protein [Pyramidobacter sp.]
MSIVYILFGILIFGVLIAVHEFGHFAVAKACNVRVNEFSVGMGPALWKKQKGETLYALRAVPIGGYCAMAGEDESSDDPRAFTNASVWKRALILCAGSFMNFLLGFVIVLLLFSNAKAFYAPILVSFMDGCPYEGEEALMVGDRFYRIDGHRVYEISDVGEYLDRGDGVHDIVVIRGGKKVELKSFAIERREYEGRENKMYGFNFGVEEATPLVKLRRAWETCLGFARMVWQGLEQLVRGQVGVKDMAGPVGVVNMMAETGEQAASTGDGLWNILYLGAFIAVNLAIVNMLPIPALDGGRVFLLFVTAIIEGLTRKKLDPKYEGAIHAAGMVLLLGLMAFVMFNDILRIVKG